MHGLTFLPARSTFQTFYTSYRWARAQRQQQRSISHFERDISPGLDDLDRLLLLLLLLNLLLLLLLSLLHDLLPLLHGAAPLEAPAGGRPRLHRLGRDLLGEKCFGNAGLARDFRTSRARI